MATESDAGDTANDAGAPTDEQPNSDAMRTVEVPLADADVERIELEIEESDGEHIPETVPEWIRWAVHMQFAQIDANADRPTVTPAVEVPPLVAERARLKHESARQRGKDSVLDEILMNDVEVRPEYQVDGYRVTGDDE